LKPSARTTEPPGYRPLAISRVCCTPTRWGTPTRSSKEEIGIFWDQIHQLFAQVELSVKTMYPGTPEKVALVWQGRGTGHNGVFVEFEGIDVFVLDNQGKILQMEAYWDAPATLSRLMP